MNTDTNDTDNPDGLDSTDSSYIEAAADRLENDTVDADTTQVRNQRTIREFDDEETAEQRETVDRPVGTLTPSGRYHAAGKTSDEWITSRWAINLGEWR